VSGVSVRVRDMVHLDGIGGGEGHGSTLILGLLRGRLGLRGIDRGGRGRGTGGGGWMGRGLGHGVGVGGGEGYGRAVGHVEAAHGLGGGHEDLGIGGGAGGGVVWL
jgi:hypothetical protein